MPTTEQIVIRLLISTLLGGIIGIEREVHNRPAGIRTHILVTLGSTLVMLISTDALHGSGSSLGFDPGRIAAQVISGIGFLGAGTILKMGNTIVGLTTAASLWVSAGIGLAIGVGYYFAGVFASFIVVVTLVYVRVVDKYRPLGKEKTITVVMDESCIGVAILEEFFKEMGAELKNLKLSIKEQGLDPQEKVSEIQASFEVRLPRDLDYDEFYKGLYGIPGIRNIRIDKNN